MDENNTTDKTRFAFVLQILNLSDRKKITLIYFVAIGCLLYTINIFFKELSNNNKEVKQVYIEEIKNLKQENKELKKEIKELYKENKELYQGKSTKLDTLLTTTKDLLNKK